MIKKIVILLPLSLIAACAYTLDREYQAVTLRTTGAQNSVCDVWADKIRYKFYPPETRNLKNAPSDLVIKCFAAGNRYREVIIKPNISGNTYKNIVNGLAPGVFVDYTSGAMFMYPDIIDIDFSHMPATAMSPPAHNNTDILNPEYNYLEEFKPGHPRMNEDRFQKEYPLQRRIRPGSDKDAYSDSQAYSSSASSSSNTDEKGDLMQVFENLGPSMNPSEPESEVLPTGPEDQSDLSGNSPVETIVIESNDVMSGTPPSETSDNPDDAALPIDVENNEDAQDSPQPLFPIE